MSLYLPFPPTRDLTRETVKQGKESHRVNTKQSRQYVPSLKGSLIKYQHHQISRALQTRFMK